MFPNRKPTIKLAFRGLMVLFINPKPSRECVIGILDEVPGHDLVITVTRSTDVGAPQVIERYVPPLARVMSLDISSADREGVSTHEPDGDDPRGFRWVIDYEGSEVYRGPVRPKAGAFQSFLRINAGTFFTDQLGIGEIKIIRGLESSRVRHVAVAIGAHVYLDAPNSTATLKNGKKEVHFEREDGVTYGIDVSHSRPLPIPHPHPNDSIYYNRVLGVTPTIDFEAAGPHHGGSGHEDTHHGIKIINPSLISGPHVLCFTPRMSISQPLNLGESSDLSSVEDRKGVVAAE